jgi:MFS family permease
VSNATEKDRKEAASIFGKMGLVLGTLFVFYRRPVAQNAPGLAFILGPLTGGLLLLKDLSLPFLVSFILLIVSVIFCWIFCEETVLNPKAFSWVEANPFPRLLEFLHDEELRLLAIPFLLTWMATGLYYVFFLVRGVCTAKVFLRS